MKTQHTPGPWRLHAQPAGDPLDLLNSTAGGFAVFSEDPHSAIAQVSENGSGQANARLIVAAPEMKEMLMQLDGLAHDLIIRAERLDARLLGKAPEYPLGEVTRLRSALADAARLLARIEGRNL